jgi:predicted transcriptional regulator
VKETIQLSIKDTKKIQMIAKALISEPRLEILKLLDSEVLNISEIADRLSIPISSAALHVKVLEEAGLVVSQPVPGNRGTQKRSNSRVEAIHLSIMPSMQPQSPYRTAYFSIPIGNYFDFQVKPPCGIATENAFLSFADNTRTFYLPEHSQAQLIWFSEGYLEYRIDAAMAEPEKKVERVEFSFEVCSEAQGYNNDWPSDITLWINGIEVGAFTTPGDFGGVRGKQNPIWWPDTMTQYGELHVLSVRTDGTYIDDKRTSDETLKSLWECRKDALLFRIGVKPDAKNVGGINLFGARFGNLSQHINVKVDYMP